MGDSYRPDRRRHSYYDSDQPDNTRGSRGRSRYDDESRCDAIRERSPAMHYDEHCDDNDDYYNRSKVWNPQYHAYNRSDDLRYPKQMPRYYDGRIVPQVPEGCPPETGEKDISPDNVSIKLVLVRGLTTSTDETLFAKGMEKFYEGHDGSSGGAEPKSLRRVLLIRERRSDQSLGYGFAEYDTSRNAQAAVNKAPQLRDANMCTIRSSEISLHFPHLGVFPNTEVGVMELNKKYTVKMPGSQRIHKYHDERYYASELIVNDEPPKEKTTAAQSASIDEKTTKKIGGKRGIETLEGKQKKLKGSGFSAPPIIQHYQKKQAELRGETDSSAAEASKQPASGVNVITTTIPLAEATEDEQTFAYDGEIADKNGKVTKAIGCYLCVRNFNTRDGLLVHVKESQLHANNLKDSQKIDKGHERMKQNHIDPEKTLKAPKPAGMNQTPLSQMESQELGGTYRDRAAERRQEQTEIVRFTLKGANQSKKTKGGNVSGSSSDNESSKPTYGKGMNMLQKAGWSEGEGLGAGRGIKAPINQSLYASGVGLGHESSKKGDAVEEASRMTRNDHGDFLEKTKELAKKRYEEMK